MAKKANFCEPYYMNANLNSGHFINVGRSLTYMGENADFKSFLNVPVKNLERQLKASEAKEKAVFNDLKKAIVAWDEHAAQSLLLQMAIEYVKAPEVKHTKNEWKKQKDNSWEISNRTYKMVFSIKKDGDEWKLSWELSYTAPGLACGYWPYSRYPRDRIEYEGSKKYKTKVGAQKYIQNKYDEKAHLFMELSPPVPEDAKSLFCVNGQLLPGYTLARKEKAPQEVAEELLDLLDDADLAAPSTGEPPKSPEESATAQGQERKSDPDAPVSPKTIQGKKPASIKKPISKKKASKKQPDPVR